MSSRPAVEFVAKDGSSSSEEDEEAKDLRFIEERKRRRLEIVEKHEKEELKREKVLAAAANGPGAAPSTPWVFPSPSKSNTPTTSDEADKSKTSGINTHERDTVNKFIFMSKKISDLPEKEDALALGLDKEGDIFGADFNATKADQQDIKQHGASMHDWDDKDGYYCPRMKELINDRYQVNSTEICGRGVFANVVKCLDTKKEENPLVAIKFIRNNDMMKKCAMKEISVLKRLNQRTKDPDQNGRRAVIRMYEHFDYRGHTCLVFECMSYSLREGIKRVAKPGRGASLKLVQEWTKQFFQGLRHMHKNGLVHADVKPDNIVAGDCVKAKTTLRICDLGSALDQYEIQSMSLDGYHVSRFYRAPEICLGTKYENKADIWSGGCTIWEMLKNETLFAGKANNNGQLKAIMDKKGKCSTKVIKAGAVWRKHFNDDLDFMWGTTDPVSKASIVKLVTKFDASPNLLVHALVQMQDPARRASSDPAMQRYMQCLKDAGDLLSHVTALDPARRYDCDAALKHPFCRRDLDMGPLAKKAKRN